MAVFSLKNSAFAGFFLNIKKFIDNIVNIYYDEKNIYEYVFKT